jgi:hypothetical protein
MFQLFGPPKLQHIMYTPAPVGFQGSWSEFFDKHIEPNLVSPQTVERVHDWLMQYCDEPSSVFSLRLVRGLERRRVYSTVDGTLIAPSDNAPAWVLHALLVSGEISTYEEFRQCISKIPSHMFDVRQAAKKTANDCGWYFAHIFPAKNGDTNFANWNRKEVQRRFLRSVHPCNFFLVPLSEKVHGEDRRVIAFAARRYEVRYGSVWASFLKRIDGHPMAAVDSFGDEMYRLPETAAGGGQARYQAKRLTFKKRIIEPLADDGQFEVVTPMGVYRFSKREFYQAFPNIVASASYREAGIYHGEKLHLKASAFRLG